MAETTPKKKTTATTTKPKAKSGGQTLKIVAPKAGAAQQEPANPFGSGASEGEFLSDYEEALYGVQVYGGVRRYTSKSGKKGEKYYRTGEWMLRQFSLTDDPEKVRAVQEKLYKAGLYGSAPRKNIRWGDKRDPDTLKAYVMALRGTAYQNLVNHIDITFDANLDEAGKYQSQGDLEDSGAVFAFTPEDPAKLRRLLQEGIPEVLDKALSPAEIETLVAKYQSMDESAARSQFSAQQGGGVAAPSPDFNTFALNEAERLHPDDFRARKLADLSKQFLASMGDTPETAIF